MGDVTSITFLEDRQLTFSLVARCPRTLDLGVCVATASLAVGNRVPHVKGRVGAIATQAETNVRYGIEGLKQLEKGVHPRKVLENLLKSDRSRETRQVIMVDVLGRTAAFTGRHAIDWKGHLVGRDCVAAGNRLVGGHVLEAMMKTFESSEGNLAERLIKALEAGQAAGGDKLGATSAALLVARGDSTSTRPALDLRVNESLDPIGQLRELLEARRGQTWK